MTSVGAGSSSIAGLCRLHNFEEFRGLQRNLFAASKKTSNFASISSRKAPCFALNGDAGFGTPPRSRDGDILMGENARVVGQDYPSANTMLQVEAAALGTISADIAPMTDDFSVDIDELDLACPTEGFSSIPEAIEDIRQGKLVVVVDDEERENEGDLIMAASLVTPEAMAFMVRHGTGIVCASMKGEDLERLQVPLMVMNKEHEEKLGTAFTVSVVCSLSSSMRQMDYSHNQKLASLPGMRKSC